MGAGHLRRRGLGSSSYSSIGPRSSRAPERRIKVATHETTTAANVSAVRSNANSRAGSWRLGSPQHPLRDRSSDILKPRLSGHDDPPLGGSRADTHAWLSIQRCAGSAREFFFAMANRATDSRVPLRTRSRTRCARSRLFPFHAAPATRSGVIGQLGAAASLQPEVEAEATRSWPRRRHCRSLRATPVAAPNRSYILCEARF